MDGRLRPVAVCGASDTLTNTLILSGVNGQWSSYQNCDRARMLRGIRLARDGVAVSGGCALQTVPQIPAGPSASIVFGARLLILRGSWLQISIEPVDQPRHHVGLVRAFEEDMALVGIDDELRLHLEAPQRIPVFV